jgi:2,3-bisphosphoglycerate-independent phosphoglycerate mutase
LDLKEMGRTEIDADLADMAIDVDYQREAVQIMAEFASVDAETARMIDDEYGPYPYDEEERAELANLARANEAS